MIFAPILGCSQKGRLVAIYLLSKVKPRTRAGIGRKAEFREDLQVGMHLHLKVER